MHPEFDLEIADIPEANLPLPPKADNRLHFTMRDYVRNVDDSFNILSETQVNFYIRFCLWKKYGCLWNKYVIFIWSI